MSIDMSGVSGVLARIATIEAKLSPQPAVTKSTAGATNGIGATDLSAAATGTTSTDFAALLSRLNASGSTGSVSSVGAGSATGDQIVTSAKKYLGVPYVFGGTTTAGLDCSGFIQKAYGDLGISIPRLSWDQAKIGSPVANLAQAQPGDILGFGTPAHHVAIYLGNNQMIAAPQPGENVKIQSVYETPASIRRVVSDSASPLQAGTLGTNTVGTSLSPAPAANGISAAVQQYSTLFSNSETQYGLPTGILAAVAQTESGGNASAVSPAGAQGLMQLMPTTASGMNVNPWDPSQSIQGASKLLSGYLNKYHSIPLALAAYNAGPGAVDQYGGVPPYAETQNYVSKITNLMASATP